MKNSLQPGLTYEFKFKVPENKTVSHLYPESPEFQVMPNVLATGYMVGLFEWTCIQAINPHIDWPREQTVGIDVKLEEVEGRKLVFSIVADDGIDKISEGTHDRFIIDAAKFNSKMAAKINPK